MNDKANSADDIARLREELNEVPAPNQDRPPANGVKRTRTRKKSVREKFGKTSKEGNNGVKANIDDADIDTGTDIDVDANADADAETASTPKNAKSNPFEPFPPKSGRSKQGQRRPCFGVYREPVVVGGRNKPAGLYYHTIKGGAVTDEWVCGPLIIVGTLRNNDSGPEDAYGLLLEFQDRCGDWHKWALPMEMLSGKGEPLISELLKRGLHFSHDSRQRVVKYLCDDRSRPPVWTNCWQIGWADESFTSFVLPSQTIGPAHVWPRMRGVSADFGTRGTLEQWQKTIGVWAIGNPFFIFTLSFGLVGPLLGPLGFEGAGIHLCGDSSQGKTTLQRASSSQWGGKEYMKHWRTTSNAAEGAGRQHNDTLLVRDELGAVRSSALDEILNSALHGHVKGRANIFGEAKATYTYRVPILSSGELTIKDKLAAEKIDAKAGQLVRLLELTIKGNFGVFNELHEFRDGKAFSEAICEAGFKNYGHTGPAFVRGLIEAREKGLSLRDRFEESREEFISKTALEGRAANTFRLTALAGELAIGSGLYSWERGSALKVAKEMYEHWRETSGKAGEASIGETQQILSKIREFIDSHGTSRFQPHLRMFDDFFNPWSKIPNRAGFIEEREPGGGPIVHEVKPLEDKKAFSGESGLFNRPGYLFLPVGLKEAVPGFTTKRIVAALKEVGALYDTRQNAKQGSVTRRIFGQKVDVYCVDRERLTGELETEQD